MDSPVFPKSEMRKLPTARRKTIRVLRESLVKSGFLVEGSTMPFVIETAVPGIDLISWAAANRVFVETNLSEFGAVLFRNFNISAAPQFEAFIRSMSGDLLEYQERSSPRRRVSGQVYTSTDYPPEQSIFPHNENSYSHTWPLKIYFFCQKPASQGGETPLVDARKVYRRIAAGIRERFIEKHCMYVRNFGGGMGLTWQTVFQTTDKSQVEQYCRRAGIDYEWVGPDRLRTRHVRPAVARHPQTGELVWFNHATFFHVSTLEASVREVMLAGVNKEDLPNNTYYGDGSEIELPVLAELRDAYHQEAVSFEWKRGDVLLVDNMLTAHARNPYVGERKVLVGMAEAFSA